MGEPQAKMGEPMGEPRARVGVQAPQWENRWDDPWENGKPKAGLAYKKQNGRTTGRTEGQGWHTSITGERSNGVEPGPTNRHQNGRTNERTTARLAYKHEDWRTHERITGKQNGRTKGQRWRTSTKMGKPMGERSARAGVQSPKWEKTNGRTKGWGWHTSTKKGEPMLKPFAYSSRRCWRTFISPCLIDSTLYSIRC